MEVATIQARPRTDVGKKKVRYLRGEGRLPAVLYGMGGEAVNVSLDAHQMTLLMNRRLKVFKVQMDGGEQPAFLKDVQWDVLTDEPLHVDLMRIDMKQPIRLTMELSFLGHPVGASKGGTLVKDHTVVELECLPETIPEAIEVNVSPLDLGQGITVGDLQLPEGCRIDLPPDSSVCRVPGAS